MSFNYGLLDKQHIRPLEIEDLFDEDDKDYVNQLNEWLTKLDYCDLDSEFDNQYRYITIQYIKYILHKHQRNLFLRWYNTVEDSWKLSKDSTEVQSIANKIKMFFDYKFKSLINEVHGVPYKPYSAYIKKCEQFEYIIQMITEHLTKHKPLKLLKRKKEVAYSPDSDLSILLDAD